MFAVIAVDLTQPRSAVTLAEATLRQDEEKGEPAWAKKAFLNLSLRLPSVKLCVRQWCMILFECLIVLTLVAANLLVGSCLLMAGRADCQINQFDELRHSRHATSAARQSADR
jgi:hypothetical protein